MSVTPQLPEFVSVTGTAVQALVTLSRLATTGGDDEATNAALDAIGDPTGETWSHLVGLCLELGPPRSATQLVDLVAEMDPIAFRLVLLGMPAWSWRSIVGADTIAAAADGDADARRRLLEDDRYYARVADRALPTVLAMDAPETKRRFLDALQAFLAHSDVEQLGEALIDAGENMKALAAREGWIEAVDLLTGYRYVPEPEARRVAVMPHLAGPGLLLAQHKDVRLVVYGADPPADPGQRIVAIGGALADPTRVAILSRLTSEPHQLGEILDAAGLTRSTVHHHLRRLREAGLVTVEGNARAYRYQISRRGRDETIRLLGELLGITTAEEATE